MKTQSNHWIMFIIKKEDKKFFINQLIKEKIFTKKNISISYEFGKFELIKFKGTKEYIDKIFYASRNLQLHPLPLCIEESGDF